MFTPDELSPDVVCIPTKSLSAYYPDERLMINSFDNDKYHNPGQIEGEHQMHDQLNKTTNFPVLADGFVTF
jgi:hypothetical protein